MELDNRGLPPQLKEGDEMDGGIVDVKGQKMRLVLDHLGRHKKHRPIDGDEVRTAGRRGKAPTAMEAATERGIKEGPPAVPAGEKTGGKAPSGAQGGQGGQAGGEGIGFKPPS